MTTIKASPFVPSGVITLTTDFGLRDPFVGVMKGVILRAFPAAKLIDLTHGVEAFWPQEAGFWLERTCRYFPDGTVHVAVVDPGVGSSRDIILLQTLGQLFLAPDNGLLAQVAATAPFDYLGSVQIPALGRILGGAISTTFHGRDIFAPFAAGLAAGTVRAEDVTRPVLNLAESWLDEPVQSSNKLEGVVVTIDNFGNLITNIPGKLLQGFAEPRLSIGSLQLRLRRTYSDAQPGEYLALINSFETIEIARAQASAAEGLGLGRGTPIVIHDMVRHR